MVMVNKIQYVKNAIFCDSESCKSGPSMEPKSIKGAYDYEKEKLKDYFLLMCKLLHTK